MSPNVPFYKTTGLRFQVISSHKLIASICPVRNGAETNGNERLFEARERLAFLTGVGQTRVKRCVCWCLLGE